MEGRICCAYNVSRGKQLCPKVAVVERADQPLTVMRLLVECLGFKAEMGLWLSQLRSAPQLVRPFPFDLVYLDDNLRVIVAVELLPEVRFPAFDERVASALILPVRTICSTETQEGDELAICGTEELELRLAGTEAPVAVSGAEVGVAEAEPVAPVGDPVPTAAEAVEAGPRSTDATASAAPPPVTKETVFAPVRISPLPQSTAFTVGVTTTWHLANSTFEAVLPVSNEVAAGVAGSGGSIAVPAAEVEPAEAGKGDVPVQDEGVPEHDAAEGQGSSPAQEPDVSRASQVETVEAHRAELAAKSVPKPHIVLPPEQKHEKTTEPMRNLTPLLRETEVHESASRETAIAQVKTGPRRSDVAKATTPKPKASSRPASATLQNLSDVQRTAGEGVRRKPAAEVADANLAEHKQRSCDGRRKSFGFLVKEFLNCPDPLPENRLSARLVQQGMVAFDRPDEISSSGMPVRDVSPSGFYVRTKTRWKLGQVLTLRLERSGAREDEYQSRVDVNATVVRSDKDGVGLKWVFPEGVNFEPWDRLPTKRADESDLQYFIRELRLSKAQGFLQRISPLAKSEIRHALHERLSNKRVASAVEIALQAEKALSGNGAGAKTLAHSDVVMRIIESGSWIEDNWIRTMWAGLLVSACTADGQDTSNLTFIDLLARQTPVHLRILSYVCKRVEEAVAGGATPKSVDVFCSAQELTDAADSHSFARIQQTIGQLATSGLIVESVRPSYASVLDKEKTRATPTSLGFSMYARCNGRCS